MSYSPLPFTSKLFQFTSLTCALALAGCGGGGDGDTVDSVAPAPDLGVTQPGTGGGTGGNGNAGGDEQVPDVEPDFFIQKLNTAPTIIELSDEQAAFSVTVKAVEKVSGGAMVGKAVTLKVVDSENNGITIEGQSTQTTDNDGNAVYALKLNPQAVADKDKLIANGFTLVATANKADGTSVAPQELKVSVNRKGSGGGTQVIESKLDISTSLTTSSVSNNVLNVYGDTATLSVIAKNSKGARVQDVKVGLGIDNIKGISIVGGSSKVTNADGIATFSIKIDENLSKAERDALLQGEGIAYAISIQEQNGATKQETDNLTVALPISDYVLDVKGRDVVLNAYGDEKSLTITATAKNSKVPTSINGAKGTIKLNNAVTGVKLSTEAFTFDTTGKAVVSLIVAPTLTAAQRKEIVEKGVSYTVVLSEPNRSTTAKNVKSMVEIPTAKYDISFDNSSKKQLSSSGGTAVISFRVNDKNGGAIANQKVTASLPKILTDARLLTFNGAAEQNTDAKGMVSYTVIVPTGLTVSQKEKLEKTSSFILTATATEASGAGSSVSSQPITIGSDIGKSDITLSLLGTLPSVITPLNNEFTLQLSGKRMDGSAANDRVVKLILDKAQGVTIVGNEQMTNNAGMASFTIQINPNLTLLQRDALIQSGINYTAVLTDNDGTQSKINQKIDIKRPATSIQFGSIINPSISQLGGTGQVNVKLVSKQDVTQAIRDQQVTIKLDNLADTYGVTVTPITQNTDFNGQVVFTINVPADLTITERADLKNRGISYQLSYVENGVTYEQAQKVQLTTPSVALNILNTNNDTGNQVDYQLNNMGDNTLIQAQLSNQTNKTLIANQPVSFVLDNKALARLLIVNGQAGSGSITANTDSNGVVNFEVIVENGLSDAERDALSKQLLTATLTETLTNKTQQVKIQVKSMSAVISLINDQSNPLNLNGGETQIVVTAQDKADNIVAGQKVFLALPAAVASQGITLVSSSSQITDNSGRATFTIAAPNNLTDAQKDAIGNSFAIALSAADRNNTIVTQASSVATVRPTADGTQENLTIGANKVVNTKGDTFKVFVRVANNDGSIGNREVRLNVNDPIKTGVTISNNIATTNGDGVATFDLTLIDDAKVNQAILEAGIKLTATTTTAENIDLIQNYIVAVDTATIDSYQLIASSDKSTLNTGGDQTNATFRVTDSNGGILVGVPVQLSIEDLEASGAALTTPSMVTTDANGQIDVGVILAANSINSRLNHSVVINAKIVTPQYDADGKISMQVREEKSLSLSAIGTEITITATEANLKDGASTTITTTLVDGAGRAIANAGMELVDANGDVIHSSATAISNADGKAVFNVNEADLSFDSNGNLRVFARALGENSINTQRSPNSIELVKISQAGISFINLENVYNVDEPQLINVQIRADSAEQAATLVGKEVEVQTTIGSLIPNYLDKFTDKVIVTKPIKQTDIQGNIITVKVWLKSNLAGTAVLQATVLGENVNGQPKYQTTVDTRFRATTPAKMLFQAVKSVITPGSSTEIVATVKDKNDVPVEGQTVVFSRASDSSAGRLSAATAVTNSRGEARVVYQANASSPIGGVIINARLLQDNGNIGSKTTNITVSKEAVYTTLAFSNKLSSDDIYYTVRGSISVMDGSGRAVANQEVSIKSYATEYAQGVYCLLDSTTTYQAADIDELDEFGNVIKTTTPEPKVFSEKTPVPLKSDWYPTEDANYNYTLDQDSDPILNEDKNSSGKLEAINPVTILGSKVSEDGYSFITDDEGRADFEIRYPLRYSNWVKVRFDASTFVNGSENTQSINYQLPTSVDDLIINDTTLITPWIGNASPFGTGGATCTNSLSVTINENTPRTRVTLSPYSPNYNVTIDGQGTANAPSAGFNTYIIDFNKAFEIGSTVTVNNNGFGFSKVIKVE
ncbi:Ig-like domain-containing protein [Psychrobacter sp. SMN/5/1215-MNA-CIBAN-0208]|uniref:Ig-like domain-containing protein n=1 Tax=Psychrobacter sp. SMN/5/1215-MNA-CIBAN-0208 TaxID=3140442 RepID=UPI0033262E3D